MKRDLPQREQDAVGAYTWAWLHQAKFYPNCFLAALKSFGSNEIIGLLPSLKRDEILRVVKHFNLSVLANETLSVSLCREIDNVFGAVRTCFDHVLSKFSGFSWERILFLKSACVNMVMQIQLQIGDTRRVFYESAWESWGFKKNYSLREIPKTRFRAVFI